MNEKRKRPNYAKEFKQDAVKLVIEQRYSYPEVGRRLGVAASNVSRWVRQFRQDQQDISEGGLPRKELEAEIRRLKKENKRLEMEREILKKSRGLLCERVELRYDFIRREKKAYTATILCKVMKVSRSEFYDYLHSLKKYDDPGEVALKARISALFKEHRDQYGSRRIVKQIQDEGHQIDRYSTGDCRSPVRPSAAWVAACSWATGIKRIPAAGNRPSASK